MKKESLEDAIKTPDEFIGLIKKLIIATQEREHINKVDHIRYYRTVLREAERLLAVDNVYRDYGKTPRRYD